MSKNILLTLTVFSFLFACGWEEEPLPSELYSANNDGLKIMPLGASRVEGASPSFESYRYELWELLNGELVAFDFIGTQEDETFYPESLKNNFDYHHEGHGGWTSGKILDQLDVLIQDAGVPDIVLFSSPGGNDALEGLPYDQIVANTNQIIDILQAVNPSIVVIIELPAPASQELMIDELQSYFNQILIDIPSIAQAQTSAESQVIIVDMFTGFDDSMLADEVHYNEKGAKFIASRYFEILVDFL